MSILLLKVSLKKGMLVPSGLPSLPKSALLFSGSAPLGPRQGGHLWPPASCVGLQSWARLRARPQALCMQPGCVPASRLRRGAQLPPQAVVSPYFFPSEGGLLEVRTELPPFHFCVSEISL